MLEAFHGPDEAAPPQMVGPAAPRLRIGISRSPARRWLAPPPRILAQRITAGDAAVTVISAAVTVIGRD